MVARENPATAAVDLPAVPQIHNNILETMGSTPLVRLNRVARGVRCQMIAKVEYLIPAVR